MLAAWEEIRCPSPTCDKAHRGGRVLFTRQGSLIVKAGSNGSIICEDDGLLGGICRCGAPYKREDVLKGEDG